MPPRVVRIRSENAEFQHVETLRRNRRKRHRHREFFVEGVRPINRLRANGWPVHAWCYGEQLSDWARAIVDDSTATTHTWNWSQHKPFTADYPTLSGQHRDYLVRALID